MKKTLLKPRLGTLAILLFTVVAFAYTQGCPSDLTAYWKLNESEGPDYSDFMENHDASSSSSPTQTDGIIWKGQAFSGSSVITVPSHSDFSWAGTAGFTIELWVNYSTPASTEVFIGRDDVSNSTQWWIGALSNGHINWLLRSSDGTLLEIETSISYAGGWVHIVAVRDGDLGQNILYINGTAQTSSITYTGNFSSSADINIGAFKNNNDPLAYYYNGVLDDIAIYSRALSASEVTAHYENGDFDIGYCDGTDPVFLSSPVTKATVGQAYYYDVEASGKPTLTYSLTQAPDGMTIDPSTGLISWTPATINANGLVNVRATNGSVTADQNFVVYVADAPVCRENLIAYWDFNNAGISYFDNISNFELHGTAPSATTGRIDGGLSFDGVNDSLNMTDPEGGENVFFDWATIPSFSWEVWMKSSASPSKNMVLIGRKEPENSTFYWLGINSSTGQATFHLTDYLPTGSKEIYGGPNLLDGVWHHIVATYDATSNDLVLYVDKTNVANDNQNYVDFGGNDPLNIGWLNTSTDKFWYSGAMDELAFYSVALSETEVANSYDAAVLGDGPCVFNYAPVITSTPVTEVDQDATYTYNITASDTDGDDITLSAEVLPSWLDFNYTGGETTATLTGTPDNSNVGDTTVTIRVSDGEADVDQVFDLTVVNVNDAPEFTSTPVTAALEGTMYNYTVTAEDVDVGDVLTYSVPVLPSWLNFNTGTQKLSGTPTGDNVGDTTVTIRINDGTVDVDQTFTITVQATNAVPVFTSIPITTADDYEEYSYTVTATDDDGNDLTFAAVAIPGWATFNAETGVLSGIPKYSDADSTFDVTLSVTDGIATEEQEFQITVGNTNDAPVFTSTPDTVATVGTAYLYEITVDDPDEDDVLTFNAVLIPTWLSLTTTESGASLAGTPTNDNTGKQNVIIEVSDGTDDEIQSFSITVGATGINRITYDLIKSAYPNPANDYINIDLIEPSQFRLIIYNMSGAIQKDIESEFSENIRVNISDLPSGIYYYKVIINDKIDMSKFSKQ